MEEQLPAPPKTLTKRQYRLVVGVIEYWRQRGTVDEETAKALHRSIAAASFDWKRTARYAFLIALGCFLIAVSALLADEALRALLKRLFTAPDIIKSLFFTLCAASLFYYGLRRRGHHPQKSFSNEAVFFLGVLSLALAVGFLGIALDLGRRHYSLLFLAAALLYALLGLLFPSRQVWVFGLLSLGAWLGTETGYLSGGGMYFLGMNQPLRFVFFGAVLTLAGIWGERTAGKKTASAPPEALLRHLMFCAPPTKVIGLLYLFIALWIMSIFGNYGDLEVWHKVPQYTLFYWSVLFGAVAVVVVWYGLRQGDAACRGFGLTFLLINLYTRFFEYFWKPLHKALFFAVLAASFWYLGARAERLWRLGQRQNMS